jgi:hypothetical protein
MSNHNKDLLEYIKTAWGTESPSTVVAKIAKGDRLATEALGLSPNAKYRAQVVQAGAVDKLLEFLIKTDKFFRDVLPPTGDTQISCPSTWLNLVNNFCQDGFLQPESLARDVQYKIIINLGPLFQDMSNLENRILFGDRDIWVKSLMFFCNILYSLVSSNFDRIADFLLKQKTLQSFLVRILYLPLGEPEITQEIHDFSEHRDDRLPKPDIVGTASTFCACAIKALWSTRGVKNPTLIESWAATPIRPEHELRLMTGLLQLLQLKTHGDGWYQGGYSATLTILLILFDKADRLSGPFGVDSVAEVLVGVCRQHLIRYAPFARDRFFVENVLTGMVITAAAVTTPVIQGKQAPVDYSVAKAIRAGLFDFLIECCDANDPRLANAIEGSIRTLNVCLILADTQQAMQELAPSIRAKMERIQDRHPVLLPPLQHISELLGNPMIKAPPMEETCAFCQEKTTPQTLQKCPFCKTIIYCSKDCQRLNWMIHQVECSVKRKEPVAPTPEQLLADGKRFFALHISKMLLQAS